MADNAMPARDANESAIDRKSTGLDILDAERIVAALSPSAKTALATLDVIATIDSTNSELLRRRTARDGTSVLFAERQTGGRGRHGRLWVSPPACNLYVSVARYFALDLARLGGLSIVVGVAAAEALRGLGLDAIALKWPNDLVVADGDRLHKLGGVLIESDGLRDGAVRAVIGLGLNVRMAEAASTSAAVVEHANAIDQPWTDVRSVLGAGTPTRNAIAAAVLDTLLPALAAFERDGLAPTLERYASFDALRGRTVETHGGAQPMIGVADGIADDGALRLSTAAGVILLRAGEVSVRPRDVSMWSVR